MGLQFVLPECKLVNNDIHWSYDYRFVICIILSCYEATEQCETAIMVVVGKQIRDIGVISTITLGRDGFTNITCFPLNDTLESP